MLGVVVVCVIMLVHVNAIALARATAPVAARGNSNRRHWHRMLMSSFLERSYHVYSIAFPFRPCIQT